jgi:hypothetical protein
MSPAEAIKIGHPTPTFSPLRSYGKLSPLPFPIGGPEGVAGEDNRGLAAGRGRPSTRLRPCTLLCTV